MNELPPLPDADMCHQRAPDDTTVEYSYSADAVQAYARAAIEAHEARKVPSCKVVDVGFRWDADRQEHVPSIKTRCWGWIDVILASAPPAPQHENETINKLRTGYPAAIDAAIREQASAVKKYEVASLAVDRLGGSGGIGVTVDASVPVFTGTDQDTPKDAP